MEKDQIAVEDPAVNKKRDCSNGRDKRSVLMLVLISFYKARDSVP